MLLFGAGLMVWYILQTLSAGQEWRIAFALQQGSATTTGTVVDLNAGRKGLHTLTYRYAVPVAGNTRTYTLVQEISGDFYDKLQPSYYQSTLSGHSPLTVTVTYDPADPGLARLAADDRTGGLLVKSLFVGFGLVCGIAIFLFGLSELVPRRTSHSR